jgi:tetratricopeptide (TPR) repeat protein
MFLLHLVYLLQAIASYGSCDNSDSAMSSQSLTTNSCKSVEHWTDSRLYFDQGNLLWENEKYEESVPFYRAAVRLCPEYSAEFWLKLGNAEFNRGLTEKAIKRWERAKTIADYDSFSYLLPSNYEAVLQQLKERKTSNNSTGDEYHNDLEVKKEEFIIPFHEIDASSFSFTTVGESKRPFVVRNFLDFPPSYLSSSKIDGPANSILKYLRTNFPNESVEWYPQNMLEKPSRLYHKSLNETLDYLFLPAAALPAVDASLPGTYLQWKLQLPLFQHLFTYFWDFSNASHVSSMEFGENGRVSLNYDMIPFFYTLIQKLPFEKQHLFMEPLQQLLISSSSPTSVNPASSVFEGFNKQTHWYMLLIGEEGSGMFHHQDNLPLASWQIQLAGEKKWIACSPYHIENSKKERQCFSAILKPGDLIFYPKSYSHETHCLSTPTVSLSGTVIPSSDYEEFIQFIKGECDTNKVGYKFHRLICGLIQSVAKPEESMESEDYEDDEQEL